MNVKEIQEDYFSVDKVELLKKYGGLVKKTLIPNTYAMTKEDVIRLHKLSIEIQLAKQDVLQFIFDFKQGKMHLDNYKDMFLIRHMDSYKKQTNNEMRALFIASKNKKLAKLINLANLLEKYAELIMDLLNSHSWALQALIRAVGGGYNHDEM